MFLILNKLFPFAQSTSDIALALAVIAHLLCDFAYSIATRTLHLPGSLALVALLIHDVELLMYVFLGVRINVGGTFLKPFNP